MIWRKELASRRDEIEARVNRTHHTSPLSKKNIRLFFGVCLCTAAVTMAWVVAAGGRFPWRQRIGRSVDSIHITAHKNTPIALWPEEPNAPEQVDPARFEQALEKLCGNITPNRRKRFSERTLAEAERFGVDPFLLGALMYDQSQCWPHTLKRDERLGRYGLTRIPVSMHAPHIRKGMYTYYIKEAGGFSKRTLEMTAYPFSIGKAHGAKSNLYFAAAILKVFSIQWRDLHETFKQVPHRHYISHWFYGDGVRGVEPENRVLTARRRFLAYYNTVGTPVITTVHGNPIVSPLDGVPRLVLDYFSNPRGKKNTRGHRGIDLDAATGEPVRAMADGRVTFAGVDHLGIAKNEQLTPEGAAAFPRGDMGPGGLYVSINHKNHFGTIYMHLDAIAVTYQDQVKAGQIIGTAGRTGTKKSGTHLHLEFRINMDREDPAVPLAPVLVNPHLNKPKKGRRRR